MAKISASLESKTSNDLTLETKGLISQTWADMTMSWEDQKGTWAAPRASITYGESKTSVDLTLESK